MMTLLCDCGWEIPGVEKLPWHAHTIRTTYKNALTGLEITMPGDAIPQDPPWATGETVKDIHISVDWKEVARQLSRDYLSTEAPVRQR